MTIKEVIEATPALVAALAFFWGVVQYFRMENYKRETRQIEAKKPFLDIQMKLYAEATQSAAIISANSDTQVVENAKIRFYELFWGKMALVEDKKVEQAMVQFEQALSDQMDVFELQKRSLQLAHACRNSLASSWNTEAWESHYLDRDFADELAKDTHRAKGTDK